MKQYPLVSCMMLTYNRFKPFKKAVECFLNQTYENKELIVINSGDAKYYDKIDYYLENLRLNCKFITCSYKHIHAYRNTLGELRNVGIEHSRGKFITVFDDDDIHHPERISRQIDICLKSNIHATLLRNFTAVRKSLFNTKRDNCSILKGLDGTILFTKSELRYPEMNQGEDTSFLETLKSSGYNVAVIDEPYDMYEYNFYGNNTVSKRHFEDMIKLNKPLR